MSLLRVVDPSADKNWNTDSPLFSIRIRVNTTKLYHYDSVQLPTGMQSKPDMNSENYFVVGSRVQLVIEITVVHNNFDSLHISNSYESVASESNRRFGFGNLILFRVDIDVFW